MREQINRPFSTVTKRQFEALRDGTREDTFRTLTPKEIPVFADTNGALDVYEMRISGVPGINRKIEYTRNTMTGIEVGKSALGTPTTLITGTFEHLDENGFHVLELDTRGEHVVRNRYNRIETVSFLALVMDSSSADFVDASELAHNG